MLWLLLSHSQKGLSIQNSVVQVQITRKKGRSKWSDVNQSTQITQSFAYASSSIVPFFKLKTQIASFPSINKMITVTHTHKQRLFMFSWDRTWIPQATIISERCLSNISLVESNCEFKKRKKHSWIEYKQLDAHSFDGQKSNRITLHRKISPIKIY